MTQYVSEQGLLILIAPLSLEETLVDILLQKPEISGFTASYVSGHGRELAESMTLLSMVEQVSGRQKRVQFMMHAEFSQLRTLIKEFKQVYGNMGLHYILMPVTEAQSL